MDSDTNELLVTTVAILGGLIVLAGIAGFTSAIPRTGFGNAFAGYGIGVGTWAVTEVYLKR
jgi:ABC-type transporter lipoprotein component MlaA